MGGDVLSRGRQYGDRWLAAGAVTAAGWGAVLIVAGAAADRTDWQVGGGVMIAAGMLLVLAGGWVDGLSVLALSLPLPALSTSGGVRLAPATALAGLVVLGWVIRPRRRAVRLGALPLRTAIVLSLGILISGMFAESRGAAILEIVSFSALLAVLVMATDELTAEWGRAEVLAKSIGVTGGLAGALAIVETLGLLPGRFPLTGSFFRAAGGFGWPNELGMFLALSIPFSVHAWRIAPPGMARGAATVLLAFTAAGLIATFSRGSWVAVLLAPGALLFTGQGRFVIRFWVAALLAGALFDVVSGGLVSGRVAAALTDPSAIQRLALMAAGVLMFIGSPLIGVGPGGFGHALERVGPEVIALFDFVGSAHNSYIHMAAETGVLGLVPFVAFLGAVFLVALRGARAGRTAEGVTPAEADLRRTILWAFTTALLICMFEWTLVQGVGQLIMIIAAMAAAAPELRGTRA